MNFDFNELYNQYEDDALLQIVKNSSGYQTKALQTANSILEERGWTAERIATFEIADKLTVSRHSKLRQSIETGSEMKQALSVHATLFEIFRILLVLYTILQMYYGYKFVAEYFTAGFSVDYLVTFFKVLLELSFMIIAIMMFLNKSKQGYKFLILSLAALSIYQLHYIYEIITVTLDYTDENEILPYSLLPESTFDLIIYPAFYGFGLWMLLQDKVMHLYASHRAKYVNYLTIGIIYAVIILFIQQYQFSYENNHHKAHTGQEE